MKPPTLLILLKLRSGVLFNKKTHGGRLHFASLKPSPC